MLGFRLAAILYLFFINLISFRMVVSISMKFCIELDSDKNLFVRFFGKIPVDIKMKAITKNLKIR